MFPQLVVGIPTYEFHWHVACELSQINISLTTACFAETVYRKIND